MLGVLEGRPEAVGLAPFGRECLALCRGLGLHGLCRVLCLLGELHGLSTPVLGLTPVGRLALAVFLGVLEGRPEAISLAPFGRECLALCRGLGLHGLCRVLCLLGQLHRSGTGTLRLRLSRVGVPAGSSLGSELLADLLRLGLRGLCRVLCPLGELHGGGTGTLRLRTCGVGVPAGFPFLTEMCSQVGELLAQALDCLVCRRAGGLCFRLGGTGLLGGELVTRGLLAGLLCRVTGCAQGCAGVQRAPQAPFGVLLTGLERSGRLFPYYLRNAAGRGGLRCRLPCVGSGRHQSP
ncbi:hypothetical protein ABZ383_22610 [Streptomyces sp. NPDC005900]|uniref:hypothetical protein n=1 Tax=Streptomyces sp. NPDC005900 TaxID=3154569 RepID=UPI0033C05527